LLDDATATPIASAPTTPNVTALFIFIVLPFRAVVRREGVIRFPWRPQNARARRFTL
jgi:hypothetical protein